MKLQITQQHIDRAIEARSQDPRPLPSRDCPVAQCLRERFPDKKIMVAYVAGFIGNKFVKLKGAERFTRMCSLDWHKATPGEIEITGLNQEEKCIT